MTKPTARILFLILILSIFAIACVGGGSVITTTRGSTPTADGAEPTVPPYAATATFGAEQFSLQLTAIARTGRP